MPLGVATVRDRGRRRAVAMLALGYFVADQVVAVKDHPCGGIRPPAREYRRQREVDRRFAIRRHEREEGPGVLRRRHGGGDHRPPLEGAGVVRAGTDFVLLFRGKATKIPDIARELNVAHVLEGSLRKSGNHLRITAQLIRADNGYHVWSETFDRQLDDIFKVQDEIAGAVVKALRVSLLEGEAPSAAPTSSTEAYTLYLQARSIAAGRAADADYVAAIKYLQQAITLDPKFASAWAALANIFVDEYGLALFETMLRLGRKRTRRPTRRSRSIRNCRMAILRSPRFSLLSTSIGARPRLSTTEHSKSTLAMLMRCGGNRISLCSLIDRIRPWN